MNFLAHAALSLGQKDLVTGNLISDFVKGKAQFDLPPGIQQGIRLHRMIDEFTDLHPVTREAKKWFRPVYRLYSGAFVDVVYDHFLALDSGRFAAFGGLKLFAGEVYGFLEENRPFLPGNFDRMLPFMKSEDWLFNYQYRLGIQRSFQGIVRRAAYLEESQSAFEIFVEHYNSLEQCYGEFFPELEGFATARATEMLEQPGF